MQRALLIAFALVPASWCQSPAGAYNQAAARIRNGDLRAGCEEAHKLAASSPGFFAVYNLLGLCAAARGEEGRAETLFRKSIALNPDFFDSRNNLALELLKRGRHAEAVPHLRRALALRPKDSQVALALVAAALPAADQGAAAEGARSAALSGEPAQNELLKLARATALRGDYRMARALLEPWQPAQTNAAEWHAAAGYVDYKLGEPRRAQERLRRAVELAPQAEDYWMKLGEMMLYYDSNEAAAAYFAAGLRSLPRSALLHFGLAVAWLAADVKHAETLAYLDRALELDPAFEPALAVLAHVQHGRRQWAELERTIERWSRVNAGSAELHYYRALLAIEREAVAEARRLLDTSIRLDPDLADPRVSLARLLLEAGHAGAAVQQLERAAALRPEDPSIRYRLAMAYQAAGEIHKGKAALAEFKKLKERSQAWKFVFRVTQ